jgi:hypothetical protein
MSKLFIHFLNDDQIAALKAAGHNLEVAAVTAGQHAVALIKASPVGSQITNMIHTVESQSMTGAEKAASVLVQAVPLIASFVADHGASLIASVEDTGREVIQSLFNDTLGAVKGAATTAQGA